MNYWGAAFTNTHLKARKVEDFNYFCTICWANKTCPFKLGPTLEIHFECCEANCLLPNLLRILDRTLFWVCSRLSQLFFHKLLGQSNLSFRLTLEIHFGCCGTIKPNFCFQIRKEFRTRRSAFRTRRSVVCLAVHNNISHKNYSLVQGL